MRLTGYNTTASGARFISLGGSTPHDRFLAGGEWLRRLHHRSTGNGRYRRKHELTGSTPTTITMPTATNTGGVAFVGFRDAAQPFTQLTIYTGNAGADVIGVDDVQVD